MARRFGQMLLIGCLFRLTGFGRLLSMARLLACTWLLPGLLRIARSLSLTTARRLVALTPHCRIACPEPGRSRSRAGAGSPLPMRLARLARGFSGKMGGRNEAVYRNHRDFAFDQALDVPEKL